MANDYLSFLEEQDLQRQQGEAARLAATSTLTYGVNPDAAAKARKTAGFLGVPAAVVEATPEESERQAQALKLDLDTAQAPTLRARYTDADFHKLASDDSGVLSGIEAVVRRFMDGGSRKFNRPDPSVMTGREFSAAVRRQVGAGLDPDTARALVMQGTTIDNVNPLMGESRGPAPSFGSIAAGIFNPERFRAISQGASVAAADVLGLDPSGAIARYSRAKSRTELADPEFETSTGKGLYSGGVSIVQNAPGLALSIITGNPLPGLALMGGQVSAESYGKYRERGATAGQAALGGLAEGGIEIATEALPMGFLVNKLGKAGAGEFLKGLLARELPTEQIATVLQDAVDTAIANPDKTWGQYFAERPEAAYQTLLATLVQTGAMGALNVAAGKVLPERAAAGRAEEAAGDLQQLAELMAQSKLRERAPDSFNQFMSQLAESGETPTELYIDAEQLANTLNQSAITLEELRAVAPSVAAQLDAASFVPGADVRVPVAEFAAAGPELTTALLDHLREAPDAMSRAEAQAFMTAEGDKIRADVEKQLAEREDASAFKAQVQQAAAQFEQQLNDAGKFRPEVNKAYASLLGNFYAVQALRASMPLTDMLSKYQLQVTAKDAGGARRLEQRDPGTWFHGTTSDVQKFERVEGGNMWGRGYYLTDNADTASGYATGTAGNRIAPEGDAGPNVMPVRVADGEVYEMAAPLTKAMLKRVEKALGQKVKAFTWNGMKNRDLRQVLFEQFTDQDGANAVLQKAGFVGLSEESGTAGPGRTLMVFDAKNISSDITGNTLNQPTRGALSFGDDITASPSVIALLEGADLSTFIHESGHFFLEVQADLAARIQGQINAGASVSDAERAIVADMDKILTWFGVTSTAQQSALAVWQTMTLEQRREHHETWARGFEKYVAEGRAPSQELQTLFARFRAWLVSVYKTLAGLNVILTDDVRAVMDRMLASDTAIAEAQAARAMGPLFQSPEQAGMTPEEYADYQALAERATAGASAELDARLMRDMKWLSRARDKALKAAQAEVDEARKEIEREVRAEVMSQPVYQAWQFLTGKGLRVEPGIQAAETIDPVRQSGKLRTSYLKETHPEEWKILSERRMTSDVNGMDPDIVAQLPGIEMSSGDELVKALAAAPSPQTLIEELTDARMLERHGDIASPESLARAADEAVYNELRARLIATELRAIDKANTVQEKSRRSTVDVMAKAAREYAYAVIARQKVRDLRPSQYTAAQARSAKLAREALGKNTAEAAMHKRNELVNTYAAKAAFEAQEDVKKAQAYFRKFDKRIKGIDAGYQDQIDQLLEAFDFKPATLKEIDRRKSFAAWYEEQQQQGLVPSIPDSMLGMTRKSYKDMTVEEVRGLLDTVKQIEHVGRLKNKLLLARDHRDFDAIAAEMAGSIIDHGGKARPVNLEGPNPVTDWFAGVAASHRKLSSLFRQMDGNRDHGPMYEHIGRAMNERGTMEDVMIEKATKALAELYAPLLKLRGGITGYRSKLFIPEINASLTRGGRLAVALNWGNEANRQRIMDGDKWSVDQVQAILKTLSPTELEFVNGVWAYIDSYWDEIAAKEKRLTGVEPEKVEATPFNVIASDGTAVAMRGGYYPLKYDTDRSDRAATHEAAQAAKEMMEGVFTRATTRRGHTKERLKEVKRAVRKDLNVITQHVTQVVHDLVWHEWLIDTNKFLSDDGVVTAIRDHYGPKVLKSMRDDVLGIATADVAAQTDIDRALLLMRSNVTRATMGASLTTAFLQPFGLTQSMVRIGGKHVLRGMVRWGGDAIRMENTMAWIQEKSDFMRLRATTFNRELREIRGTVAGKSKTMKVVDAGLFFMMQKMQLVADVPTWVGQYEKSLAEGLDEAAAVAMADRAVLESQGGGQTKDLAEVQRKHPMLTQFYSYFSVTLNLAAESTAATDFKNPAAVAGWLGDMALLMVIPSILPAFIMFAIKGGGDDDKSLAHRMAEWQLAYLMGTVVGVRELAGSISGFDYAGPPVGRVIGDIGKAGKQTAQGELDEPAVMAYINLLGSAFGIPTVQALRSYKGWKAWDEGEEGAGAQSVLFGPPAKH